MPEEHESPRDAGRGWGIHAGPRRRARRGGRQTRRGSKRDPAELAEPEGKRRFLEGLVAIYELGREFERHGKNPKRITPRVLAEHFGVAYAEGHVHARDRFDELVGWLRLPKSGKGY